MNIGIFSGSFNPIHIGHLILANYIVEFTEIDEVWFLVSPQNPLKVESELLDENERLEMVKLAIGGYSKLKASDFEFSLPRPSYTVHTLGKLREAYPDNEFTLLIGADNWANFERWRNYDEIIENYAIKVYPRLGYRISIQPRQRKMVEALDAPVIEISSTFIRESLAEEKDIRAFLPVEAYKYIVENNLYK
jgi:nicotinate-nucleotide adenylyltransferase